MSNWIVNFKEDKRVWDRFVSSSPQRSIFVKSKFLDSLNANYDLVTCYENNKIVAGVVIIYAVSGEPINTIFPFTQYQGMLLSDYSSQAIHSQITHEFNVVEYFIDQLSDHYEKYCLCNSWRLRDMRPFQWFNYHEPEKGKFKLDLRYAAVLDLNEFSNIEDYLSSIRRSRRRELKSSSNTFRLEYSENLSILENLYQKTLTRQQIDTSSQITELLHSIGKKAIEEGYGKLSIAMLNDVPVSAQLSLYDDRTAFLLIGGNDPDYRDSGNSTFIIVNSIIDAFNNGVREIDLCGANSPNRGDFKISFNAELYPYHESKYYE